MLIWILHACTRRRRTPRSMQRQLRASPAKRNLKADEVDYTAVLMDITVSLGMGKGPLHEVPVSGPCSLFFHKVV